MSENKTRDGGARFTPGPWLCDGRSIEMLTDDDERILIAKVAVSSYAPHDARLIASAPDLYEALERTVATLAVVAAALEGVAPGLAAVAARGVENTVAVLRKARGEE